jgi:hypothetical protein
MNLIHSYNDSYFKMDVAPLQDSLWKVMLCFLHSTLVSECILYMLTEDMCSFPNKRKTVEAE